MSRKGWIGVDLDGTLARYGGWRGADHIGEPVAPMVHKVLLALAEGYAVKVFTARASDATPEAIRRIEDWTEQHIGHRLEVTNTKDYNMVELWDDRARRVVANTGMFA